jgi:hypothetical protein
MDETKKIIKDQLVVAAPTIRELILNDSWSMVVSEIAEKNNFSPDQTTGLENETLFVLLGLEFKGDFQKNIKEGVGIPDPLAQGVAKEIYEKVFKQVEEFLPTEVEGELPAGNNLIEDSAGNADNIRPTANNEYRKTNDEMKPNAVQEEKWWEKEAPHLADAEKNDEHRMTNADGTQTTPEPIPQKPIDTTQSKPPLDILHKQTEGGMTRAEEQLSKLTTQGVANQVIRKDYPAQDPYREPIS